ncbi:Arm DNA-binding domain-containing protein [Stenotrophomonas sp. RAC2]|uniref:Arm DNA-binding domain-containing protein n=1 Tax=Stenotrophomonas sp. RAC2 TaxID=3064902 RepID=UPI0027256F50|nr:Arm DNA-binding domain-containing protein [Stenotrophomonas sp. RAC2]MDV9040734.1 Arm DNA-binding domain-containing protein [Stenotrophomonas sp. RAC2]
MFDGDGLHQEISPSGSRWWRMKYRFDGKEMCLALGARLEVPPQLARNRREDARRIVDPRRDPTL